MPKLRFKLRLDFSAENKKGKTIFGKKNSEEQAEELRQHKAMILRNVPVQGITIEDIDMNHEIYSIYDEYTGKNVYYAPLSVYFTADSLENALRFTMKEEFRTIEIIEPEEIQLNQMETVRLIQKVNEEMVNFKQMLEKRMDNWK